MALPPSEPADLNALRARLARLDAEIDAVTIPAPPSAFVTAEHPDDEPVGYALTEAGIDATGGPR